MVFNFHFHRDAKLDGFYCKQTQEALDRWGLKHHTYLKRFTYEEYFDPIEEELFLSDFFKSAEVQSNFEVSLVLRKRAIQHAAYFRKEIVTDQKDENGNCIWKTIGPNTTTLNNITHDDIPNRAEVKYERLNATVVSLEYFDRLVDNGIIRPSGAFVKCLPTVLTVPGMPNDVTVLDELHLLMLDPSSPKRDVFGEADRREFIFHVFRALYLGGDLCQYDDDAGSYFEVTKRIYREMICLIVHLTTSVQKDPQSDKLEIRSPVFKIVSVTLHQCGNEATPLFPIEHSLNFCYLTVDPVRRLVTVWYHAAPEYFC
ncbi:hypothetical protein BC937DRAFT_91129 [Endogone sp. FLAS-F59071]|nr:hypothetical protein BC937DRAFT_91129 [Endogone sp. FLAS-F59071]|eukprot:RUS16513.1 hypothetical protein BC937DRAFT_91129 [Endogone sp. FLAS-F59071]